MFRNCNTDESFVRGVLPSKWRYQIGSYTSLEMRSGLEVIFELLHIRAFTIWSAFTNIYCVNDFKSICSFTSHNEHKRLRLIIVLVKKILLSLFLSHGHYATEKLNN